MWTFKVRRIDGEWRTRFYLNGILKPDCDYFAGSDRSARTDAESTGAHECTRLNKHFISTK
jgi:hypothetical protein